MVVKAVDPQTLRHWMEQGSAVLVDVREPGEHRARHIAGSHLLPLAAIHNSRLPAAKGKLVLHCLKGGRGASACEKLLRQNPQLEIYNLEGGIDAWTAAGLPVQGLGNAFLPLDRQVQLTIGLLLLTGSVLTYFVHPLFVLMIAFMGAGLATAGATGFCGLARLIARAPWNR